MIGWLRTVAGGTGRFTIAPLAREDLYEAADIHAASFREAWGDGSLANLLAQKGVGGLSARRRGRNAWTGGGHRDGMAGFLLYRFTAGEGEVITIATAPQWRRHGAGRVLMEALIRKALEERLQELFLEVDATNAAALSLYRSLGFAKVGERKGYYTNAGAAPGPQPRGESMAAPLEAGNALVMRLDLSR